MSEQQKKQQQTSNSSHLDRILDLQTSGGGQQGDTEENRERHEVQGVQAVASDAHGGASLPLVNAELSGKHRDLRQLFRQQEPAFASGPDEAPRASVGPTLWVSIWGSKKPGGFAPKIRRKPPSSFLPSPSPNPATGGHPPYEGPNFRRKTCFLPMLKGFHYRGGGASGWEELPKIVSSKILDGS